MREVSEQNLLEAIEHSGGPLIVFLQSPLCGTCKLARRMLEIAVQLAPPELEVLEGNVNMLPGLIRKYRISSVPALLAVRADRSAAPSLLYRMGSVEQVLQYIRSVTDQ